MRWAVFIVVVAVPSSGRPPTSLFSYQKVVNLVIALAFGDMICELWLLMLQLLELGATLPAGWQCTVQTPETLLPAL